MSENARNSLTMRQQRAMAALLICRSIKEAAVEAQINERTIRRWLVQSAFRQALHDAQREVLRGTLGRLQSMTTAAGETLAPMLDAQSESVRVVAAKEILARAVEAAAISDLESRVERLEGGKS